MKVFINLQKLTDSPYLGSDEHPFIFDKGVINDLVQDIKLGNPTCYLITGYRGAGKSSFIRKVEYAINENNKILFIHSSFAKYESHAYLLRKLIRGLYQNLTDEKNKEIYTELRKEENNGTEPKENKISIILPALYEKTFNDVKNISSNKTRHESETKIKVDIFLLVTFSIVFIFSLLNIFIPTFFNSIWASFFIGVSSLIGMVNEFVKINTTYTKTTSSQEEFERKSLYDDEISDYIFFNLLKILGKKDFKIVFVLDELDKVNETEFNTLINEMKPYLVSGVASFIAVAGQEMFYKFRAAEEVDDAVLSTLFSRVIQVPLLTISDFRDLFKDFVLEENTKEARDFNNYSAFIDYLIFKSKQIPRKFINLIRQKIYWENDKAYLNIDNDSPTIQICSEIVRVIQKLRDEQIEINFSGGEVDYLTMQLYIISEKILRNTGIDFVFTKESLLEEFTNAKKESYLKKNLFRFVDEFSDLLLEEFIKINLIKEVNIPENPGQKYYQLTLQTAEIKSVIPQENLRDSTVLQGYYDFRNILSIIYRDKQYSNDFKGERVEMSEMINKFNQLGAFKSNVHNLVLLKELMNKADVLFVEDDIKTNAVSLFEKNKINFTNLIVELLASHLLEKLKESFTGYTVLEKRENDNYRGLDFVIKNKSSIRPDILITMKYRKRNFSIKESVSQALDMLNNNRGIVGALDHAVIVLFNYDDRDALERTKFRFRQYLIDNSVEFSNNIHLVPTGINFIQDFSDNLKFTIDPILYSNINTFIFQNQSVSTEHPEIDDHYFNEVIDISKNNYEITIAPDVSIKHWRFGMKFSKDGNFLSTLIRHNSAYPVFHLEKNVDSSGILVSFYNKMGEEDFGKPTSILNYQGDKMTIKLFSIGNDSCIDIRDEQNKSILQSITMLEGFHLCKIFAWADNRNEFTIEAKIVKS